jgi:hypothetical protein
MKCIGADRCRNIEFSYVLNGGMGDQREDHFKVRLVFFVIILLKA